MLHNDNIVEFDSVSKHFLLTQDRIFSFQDFFVRLPNFFNLRKKKYFHVLNNISLNIQRGDFIGIIGQNGSGKSTVLKLICNILKPNCGKIKVHGKVAPLLELGAGFHPELTGHENIFLYGSILSMSKNELKNKYNSIIEFSDIKQFLHTKTKFYSNGMLVRLAFSIIIHSEFDILVADEVLAVGDVQFQQKCLHKIRELHRQNKTILFVSHQLELVYKICNKIIHIENKTATMVDNITVNFDQRLPSTQFLPNIRV